MIPHDLLFKQLLSAFLGEFLELFVPELWANLDPSSLHLVEQEAPPASGGLHMLRGDLLARARLRGEEAAFLLHVEHDAYRRREDFDFFRYFMAFRERHRCRIYPVVLLSYERPRKPRPGVYAEGFLDLEVLRFRFRVIQLNRLDWRDFLQSDNPVAAALMTRMNIAKGDRPLVKAACLRSLIRLPVSEDELRLLAEFPATYLPLDPEEKRVFEGEIQGMEPKERVKIMQTANEWILKGLAQGRADQTRRMIAKILASRFHEAPEMARLEEISSPEALDRLADAALACDSLASFEEALCRELPTAG